MRLDTGNLNKAMSMEAEQEEPRRAPRDITYAHTDAMKMAQIAKEVHSGEVIDVGEARAVNATQLPTVPPKDTA